MSDVLQNNSDLQTETQIENMPVEKLYPVLHHIAKIGATLLTTLAISDGVWAEEPMKRLESAPARDVQKDDGERKREQALLLKTKLIAADIDDLVQKLGSDVYREREAAEKELDTRLRSLLAEQNPPPKEYLSAFVDQKNIFAASAEQRSRLEPLLSVAENERWNEGSRFPPMNGFLKDLLPHIEKYTGTKFVIPEVERYAFLRMDCSKYCNSVWNVAMHLEKAGLFVLGANGKELVFTDEEDEGHTIFAQSGSTVLLSMRNPPVKGVQSLSFMGEPGQVEILHLCSAKSTSMVGAAIEYVRAEAPIRKPMSRLGYGVWALPTLNSNLYRSFEVSNILLKAPAEHTRLSLSANVGKNRKSVSVPIVPGKIMEERIGRHFTVRVMDEGKEGIRISLFPFRNEAYPFSSYTQDMLNGEQTRITFVDSDKKEIETELPERLFGPVGSREMYIIMQPPKDAVAIRFTACSEISYLSRDFIVPTNKIEMGKGGMQYLPSVGH